MASAASPVADGAGAVEVVVVRAAVVVVVRAGVVVVRAGVVVVRAGVVVVVRWYQGLPCRFSRANLARQSLISASGRSPTRTTTPTSEGAACTMRPDAIAETSTAMLTRSMLGERDRVANGTSGEEEREKRPHRPACRPGGSLNTSCQDPAAAEEANKLELARAIEPLTRAASRSRRNGSPQLLNRHSLEDQPAGVRIARMCWRAP